MGTQEEAADTREVAEVDNSKEVAVEDSLVVQDDSWVVQDDSLVVQDSLALMEDNLVAVHTGQKTHQLKASEVATS